MSIKVSYWNTSKMERETEELSQFVAKVNEQQKSTFPDTNPATIKAFLRQYDVWVDSCAAAYPGNALVRKTAAEIKGIHRDELMQKLGEIDPKWRR